MRAGISFHRGPPASDVVFQHPIMEDPPSLLVDSNSPWQIPYSPLISEEPHKDTLAGCAIDEVGRAQDYRSFRNTAAGHA